MGCGKINSQRVIYVLFVDGMCESDSWNDCCVQLVTVWWSVGV